MIPNASKKPMLYIFSSVIVPILIIVLLDLYSCSSKESESGKKTTKYGGTLYFGVETPFYGLDVLGGGSRGVLLPDLVILNNLIQEPLFKMDHAGKLIPVLGLSASCEENGRSWIIQLRKDVYFHDGTLFTADAVIKHWDRMLNPENSFRGRKLFEPIEAVKKLDDDTVCFKLAHAWPAFLRVITDEHYLCSFIPSPTAVGAGTHDQKPVGTGPFKYHSWNRGDHFIVVKNEKYWREDRPYLQKIVFRVVPDHQTRYASLISNDLDAAVVDRGNLLSKAVANASLQAHPVESNGAEIVVLNTTKAPLNDVRVRKALALANDQAKHVQLVYGNAIPQITHPFGDWFPCKETSYPRHNLEQARKLISDYGKPVTLECLHSNTSRGNQTGALLQQLFKKIGVTLNPIGMATGPVVMKVINKDYQMSTWRILEANDMGTQLYRLLHSNSPNNYTGYNNSVMDQLLEEQRVETDPIRQVELLCETAAQINRNVPFFYRGGRRYHIITRRQIRHIQDMAGRSVNLANAWIDDMVKFNIQGYAIEQQSTSPEIHCPDPGDIDAIKKLLRGTWQGKDNWGATITLTFNDDGTVTGVRTGGPTRTGNYIICGKTIYMHPGAADLEIQVSEAELSGQWKQASYKGNFTLIRKPST